MTHVTWRRIRKPIVSTPLILTAVATLLLGATQRSSGQNMGFTPGDAFFVFHLSENAPAEKDGTVTLYYPTPLIGFGGYAGFDILRIEDVPPQFVENLRRVYQDDRKHRPKIVRVNISDDGTKSETEMNPPIAFVYNRDVDWAEQRIALKYNEDWHNLPSHAFEGQGRDMSLVGDELFGPAEVYQPLVKTYEAVVEDWQNAKRFAPLKVRVPKDVPWGKVGEAIKEPLVAASKDVQIVVTNEEDLGDYVLQKPGVEFYRVTADGIDLCKWLIGDEGRVLVQEKLGEEDESQSARTKRTLPMRYHEWLGANRKNGDITIPIWPDCRVSAEQEAAIAEAFFRVETDESE